jgi:lipase maturation factor 1
MVVPGLTPQSGDPASYQLATWLFLRFLGFIYLVAFSSLALQIRGLIGARGILPVSEFLYSQRRWGSWRFHRVPTLCWLNSSDSALLFLSWGGAVLSVLLILGVAPKANLLLLWAFYLSLFNVGRIFLGYQWDVLLLEVGFLAIFLAPPDWLNISPSHSASPAIVRLLLSWTLFRLMFSSGLVKVLSADTSWRRLIALRYHYETQPLPTRPAWYAHQMPLLFHKLSAVVMFGIELFVPFLIFGPPPLKRIAAILFVVLMLLIQCTGNYGFFNLLGIALSVLLLDDKLLAPLLGFMMRGAGTAQAIEPFFTPLTAAVALLLVLLSIEPILHLLRVDVRRRSLFTPLFESFAPFHLVNNYGLFSVMTIERPEIVIEGSDDGENWKSYQFKWKPGNVRRAPRFVAPHQPRLDWQMWFAALSYYSNNTWLRRLLMRLLENSPPVVGLFRDNPFSKRPPQFIRAVLFDYRFTTWQQRSETGAWWRRERRGEYSPVLSRAESH